MPLEHAVWPPPLGGQHDGVKRLEDGLWDWAKEKPAAVSRAGLWSGGLTFYSVSAMELGSFHSQWRPRSFAKAESFLSMCG